MNSSASTSSSSSSPSTHVNSNGGGANSNSATNARIAAAFDQLRIASDAVHQPFIVQSSYKRSIAATLTSPGLAEHQQQQKLQSLSIAFHQLTSPDMNHDVTSDILADPSQSGLALFATYSRIWKEHGVAWMRGQEEPCACIRCETRIASNTTQSTNPPSHHHHHHQQHQQSSSAWSRPPAILAKKDGTNMSEAHQSNHFPPPGHAAINPHDALQSLGTNGWSTNFLSANSGAPPGNFMSSWGFPGAGANGAQVPVAGADFGQFGGAYGPPGVGATDLKDTGMNGGMSGFTPNDLSKTLIGGGNPQSPDWASFGGDASAWGNMGVGVGVPTDKLFTSTVSNVGSSPHAAGSMEMVSSHFANLAAQHGGQLPVNQQELDSLIASASAMPPGPEQQQLLGLIDMLVQLHTGQAGNQFGQTNPQSQQPSQVTLNSGSGSLTGLGPSFAPSPTAAPFPNWTNPTGSTVTGGAGGLPFGFGLNGPTASTNPSFDLASNPSTADLIVPSSSNPLATSTGNTNSTTAPSTNSSSTTASASLLMQHITDAASAGTTLPSRRPGDASSVSSDEPALPPLGVGGMPSSDWLQFQSQTSSGGSTDFVSPLRPARTATNAGYNDVPEASSPFSYDQYTNLSVSARPFQPTSQTTAAAVAAAAANLNSSFVGIGGPNGLMLQQQLSAQLNHQNELNASLAALQGVAGVGANRPMFDLVNGGLQFDSVDPLGQLGLSSNGMSRTGLPDTRAIGGLDRRDPYGREASFGGATTGGVGGLGASDRTSGSLDRFGPGSNTGLQSQQVAHRSTNPHDRRGGGRVNDYARSGMDRFDYIQQQVSQASKSKSRPFEDLAAATARSQPFQRRGAERDANAFTNDIVGPNANQVSANVTASAQQQQQMLAQLLAQGMTGGSANTNIGSTTNGSIDPSSSGLPASASTDSPPVLSAEAALKQLTTSPEFQLLSQEQQAQIYLSVQQVQASQQQAASAPLPTAGSNASGSAAATAPVSVSPVLGALQSPLSSSVVKITPETELEDVLAQIVKPDLAKLSEMLRLQQVAISNAALGGNSTQQASVVSTVTPVEVQPDKSKLRPPKRAGRTEFPEELFAAKKEATNGATTSTAPTTTTTNKASVMGQVDQAAVNQLKEVLANTSLTPSARVAGIRNVSASASAQAYAHNFVNALVQTVTPTISTPATASSASASNEKSSAPPTSSGMIYMSTSSSSSSTAYPSSATTPATLAPMISMMPSDKSFAATLAAKKDSASLAPTITSAPSIQSESAPPPSAVQQPTTGPMRVRKRLPTGAVHSSSSAVNAAPASTPTAVSTLLTGTVAVIGDESSSSSAPPPSIPDAASHPNPNHPIRGPRKGDRRGATNSRPPRNGPIAHAAAIKAENTASSDGTPSSTSAEVTSSPSSALGESTSTPTIVIAAPSNPRSNRAPRTNNRRPPSGRKSDEMAAPADGQQQDQASALSSSEGTIVAAATSTPSLLDAAAASSSPSTGNGSNSSRSRGPPRRGPREPREQRTPVGGPSPASSAAAPADSNSPPAGGDDSSAAPSDRRKPQRRGPPRGPPRNGPRRDKNENGSALPAPAAAQ